MSELVAATQVLLVGSSLLHYIAYAFYKRSYFKWLSLAWVTNMGYIYITGELHQSPGFFPDAVLYFASLIATLFFALAFLDCLRAHYRSRFPHVIALIVGAAATIAFSIWAGLDPSPYPGHRFIILCTPGILLNLYILVSLALTILASTPQSLLLLLRGPAAPSLLSQRPLPEVPQESQPFEGVPSQLAVRRHLAVARMLTVGGFLLYGLMQPLYALKYYDPVAPLFPFFFQLAFALKAFVLIGLVFLLYADFRDVIHSVRRRSELEMLGAIAASVEHDVRNPVSILNKRLAMMAAQRQHDPTIQREVGYIEAQLRRIRAAVDLIPAVRDAAEFTRQRERKWNVVDLARSAADNVRMATITPVRIEVAAKQATILVTVYRERVVQALTNLLNNAVEATLEKAEHAPPPVRVGCGVDRGRGCAVIRIRDEGAGIRPDQIAYLTSPFYSTKSAARENRGIGLFIASRIIEQHGGELRFESDGASFTVVEVALPLAEAIVGRAGPKR